MSVVSAVGPGLGMGVERTMAGAVLGMGVVSVVGAGLGMGVVSAVGAGLGTGVGSATVSAGVGNSVIGCVDGVNGLTGVGTGVVEA